MAGNDIGINLRVDAQTDGLKRAASDFSEFQQKIGSVLGVTDPEKAEQFWEEYNSGLEKAVKLRDQMSMIASRESRASGGGQGPEGGGGGGGEGSRDVVPINTSAITRTQHMLTSMVRGGSRDAAGAALGVGQDILGLGAKAAPKLGAAAGVAVGAGMALVGAGIIGNELSKTYEAVGPALLEASAALKQFGTTVEEQSGLFQITMNNVSTSAARYGYSLEEGLALATSSARGGAGVGLAKDAYNAEIQRVNNEVMRASISAGLLSSPSREFAELATLGSRYGQSNALRLAIGGANNVAGSQFAQEQATALASMFQDVLGQGIVADFDALSSTQNFLTRMFGPRAIGAGGAQIFGQLSGAVRSSTNLANETDMLKYQAARSITAGSPLDALKTLEGGFTPKLFEEFQRLISGASEWDKTFLTSQAFGVNLSTASQMLASPAKAGEIYESEFVGGKEKGGALISYTALVQIQAGQEKIANEIRNLGRPMSEIKSSVVNRASDVVKAIVGDPEKINTNVEYKSTFGGISKGIESVIVDNGGVAALGGAMQYDKNKAELVSSAMAAEDLMIKNKAKLIKLPESEQKKLAGIEMLDSTAGWSKSELDILITVLQKIAKNTTDMGKFVIEVDNAAPRPRVR